MANPSLQIGNDNWAIKEDNLLGYSTAGTRFVPQPITMTRATLGTRVNPSGLIEDVALLGSELVTNGDFSNGSTDWTLQNGWSLGNNDVEFNGTVSAYRKLFQENIITIGKKYKLTFEIKSISSGSIANFGYSGNFDTIGVKTQYFTAIYDDLFLEPTNDAVLIIDNVSVKEATIDNLPRVDYTDGTSSLLVEPQRTNTVTYSEDFSQWTIDGNASITSNATTSPDGTANATKLIAGSSSGRQAIKLNNTSSGDLAVSVFAKKGEYSVIQLSDAVNGTAFINFDLLNGSVGSSSVMTGEIVSLGNDWYKCIATYNSASSIISIRLSIAESSTSARLVNFSGNGTDGIYIWGAQLEDSYTTSYIKTSGSTVTRNQETYEKTGISDLINSEEGVLFLEMSALADDSTDRRITMSDGTTQNRMAIGFDNASNKIKYFLISSNTIQVNKDISVSNITQFNKIAFKYKLNDFALWVNGIEVDTDTSGSTFSANTLSILRFAGYSGTSQNLYGNVKQLQVFKTALSDSELATLTT